MKTVISEAVVSNQGGPAPAPEPRDEQIEKAKTAVIHLIDRIRRDEHVRYHLGYGTESFELLTAAAASLCNEPLARVRCYASGLPLCP